jgi:hypothetical protein
MTRFIRKEAERRSLDAILKALGLTPDKEPDAGETPDFIVWLSGRAIGVEITMFQSKDVVDGGKDRRMVESEWDKLQAAIEPFRQANADILDVNVGLMFGGPVPPRRLHAAFMEEVAAFIRARRAEFAEHEFEYWPTAFSASPLMYQYLRTLYLRIDRHAIWHSNLVAGFIARPGVGIGEIVAEKSCKGFRAADELWLIIQSSNRISEMLATLLGVDDFDAVPPLDGYRFARVFVLAFNGAYQWRRGEGWRQLTGTP